MRSLSDLDFERTEDQGIPKKVNRPNVSFRLHHKEYYGCRMLTAGELYDQLVHYAVRDAGGNG